MQNNKIILLGDVGLVGEDLPDKWALIMMVTRHLLRVVFNSMDI